MKKNYNCFGAGKNVWLNLKERSTKDTSFRNVNLLIFAFLISVFLGSNAAIAQTTLINPATDGGFEAGATLAANGWIAVNGAADGWIVGNAPVAATGANCGYVSSGSSAWSYSQLNTFAHLYRDITIPAGQNKLTLSFSWRVGGDGTTNSDLDNMRVFLAPVATVPVNTAAVIGANNLIGPGAISGMYKLSSTSWNNETITTAVTPGTTVRLIFSWKSDRSIIANPPAAVDNISVVTSAPSGIIATAQGGLWSNAATWVGGVVPNGDNVTIPAGSTVYVDQITSNNSVAINGNLNWVVTAGQMNTIGNFTIGTTGRILPIGLGTGQTLAVGGDFINNGYANVSFSPLFFNGSQVGGNASQNLIGSGIFEGTGTNGIIRTINFQSIGSLNVNTLQNLIVTSQIINTAGVLNTNGKITIDNTAQIYGSSLNARIAGISITNMGAGYATAPVVFGAAATLWTAAGTAVINTNYFVGNNVYLATSAGTFDASTSPSHTAGSINNGTVPLLWLGTVGTLGNPFVATAATVGTQYFYGNNLYVCTVAGTPDVASPPTHTTGAVACGGATFLYVGVPARVAVNYNATTQNVRSFTVLSEGAGYSGTPTIAFLNTSAAPTIAATSAISVFGALVGPANCSVVKSGGTTFTGGLTINSTQNATAFSGVGNISTGNGGVNYTVPPTVGFALPTAINLVTDGGSGYSGSAPTITVSGGTLVSGTALTSSNFNITTANGKVVSVYVNLSTTATYSVLPTLTITGNAILALPANCLPTATAVIGSNGQITNFLMTNAGFGYTVAPTVGLGSALAASGTVLAGTFTTAAAAPTARIALYNVQIGAFFPTTTSVLNVEGAEIPSNRKINLLSFSNIAGGNFTGNLNLISSAPLTLSGGVLNFGNNTLTCDNPFYTGTAGTATNNVIGNIRLNTPGGSATRTFPLDGAVVVATGTGSFDTGSTVTTITASKISNPSGSASPSGIATGTRATRLVTNAGATYGTNPVVTLNYNGNDSLIAENAQSLSLAQGTSITGPWVNRSATATAGPLAGTGSIITATIAPGPAVLTGDDLFAFTTTSSAFVSAQTGNWNVGSTWVGGVVPPASCDNVVINPNHVVTSSTAGNVSKNITIAAAATLLVTGGDLTVGCVGNNSALINNGTLTISGGDLKINGNFAMSAPTAFLNQTGGNIIVDGNDNNNVATSVASGTALFAITSGLPNCSAGNITIVDPHVNTVAAGAGTNRSVNIGLSFSTTLIYFSGTHSFTFGDGVSTTAGNADGFVLETYSSGFAPIQNVMVNGGAAAGRWLTPSSNNSTSWGTHIKGSLMVNANSEFRQNYADGLLAIGGNIVNNGTVTLISGGAGLNLGTNSAFNVFAPQTISGLGVYRNLASSPTANLTNLTVNNPLGITISTPLSISGTLNLVAGKVNTTATNMLTLGTATAAGTLTGGSATAYIDGPFTRTFGTRAIAATYDQTTLYPVGKGAAYQPINIAPTTTGALQLRAEAFITNAGTFGAPQASLSNRRWETNNGVANLTNAFVRLGNLTTTATDLILKASTAGGLYTTITPVTTIAATTLTSATEVVAADLGFISFGANCPPPVPVVANLTQAMCSTSTVANLAVTLIPGNTLICYTALTGGTVIANNAPLTNGNYFVAQVAPAGCESARVQIAVTTSDCVIQFANLQSPGTSSIASCQNQTFYGQVYKQGITEANGPGAGIQMSFGINSANTDPATWPITAWLPGIFNVNVGNNDEFQFTTNALAPGTYYVATRSQYTLNATQQSPFYYGAFPNGAWNGTSATNGVLTVFAVSAPVAAATQTFCTAATVADLVATGTAIKWYTTATGGTALVATTALAAGNYFASQTVNTCESALRTQVTVVTSTIPAAPTFTATAATCSANGTATVSNYNAAWTYVSTPAGATVGALGVIAGTAGTAYTFRVTNVAGCQSLASASLTIATQLVTPAVATFTTTAATCSANGTATVSNYNATLTYVSTPSGATVGALGIITGIAGTAYTFTAANTTCTTVASASVTIPLQLVTPAVVTFTTTAATCSGNGTATVSNYNALWTYVSTPAGATVGPLGVIAGTAGTAYTFRVTNVAGCQSVASAAVTIATQLPVPAAPTGLSPQNFNSPSSAPITRTIADLVASGTAVVWFASSADALANTNPLASTFVLVNNATYFAMQTVGGCRSGTPLQVLVTIILGVNGYEFANLEFYPNPVTNKLTLSNSTPISSIEVYNMLGQKVGSSAPNAMTTQYDMSNLQAATYLIQVISEGKTKMIKVLKN